MMTKKQTGLPKNPNLDFGIRQLFYVLSFYAAGMAVTPGTMVFTTIWLVFCFFASIQATRRQSFTIFGSLLLICFLGCLVLAPSVRFVRPAAHATTCLNNLRQMMLAMHNYEAANGSLPQACLLNEEGKPAHSWRVLILPFMEENNLYSMYNFDEPWDSPNNRKLLDLMPESFRCPSTSHNSKTHYKLVRGPGTSFEDGATPILNLLADGTSGTIGIVEDPANPIEWTKPDDLTLEEAVELFSNLGIKDVAHYSDELFTYTAIGSSVAMLDGSVHRLGLDVAPEELRKAFGANNGVPDMDRLLGSGQSQTKYGSVVSAVIYVILMLLPLVLLAFKKDRLRGGPAVRVVS